jgi:hypothetical protein
MELENTLSMAVGLPLVSEPSHRVRSEEALLSNSVTRLCAGCAYRLDVGCCRLCVLSD